MSSIVEHAPKFTEPDAVRIAKDLFALDADAKLLPSERDQNFHLTTLKDEAYVLKIANSTELEAVLDFQNQAMMHIRNKCCVMEQNISVAPEVCLSVRGEQITSTRGDDGTTYFVRLLTYLPGKPLAVER
jgi:hydroxylysine kinase